MSERKITITIHETVDDKQTEDIEKLLQHTLNTELNFLTIDHVPNYSIETETLHFFDELLDEAKEVAICEYINSMIECLYYEEGTDNYRKAIDESENMRTPWFVGSYILDYCREEIVEILMENEHRFNDKGNFV